MGKGVTFKFDGLSTVLKSLNKAAPQLKKTVENIMQAGMLDMVDEAKNNAPGDYSILRQGIKQFKVGELEFEFVSFPEYTPYVEFGTGAYVDVPAGLEDYAIQFKGEGKRQVNLPARPYFFPAYYKVTPQMIADINQALKDLF